MCNIIAQYNTTLAVVIVTKSTISPRAEWNPLRADTYKDLIGQYFVYNIISLQNITLQIPIVKTFLARTIFRTQLSI